MTDLFKVVGEPVAKRIAKGTAVDWWWEKTDCSVETTLYTEAQLLAAYAKGMEDMRERAAKLIGNNQWHYLTWGQASEEAEAIRALPIPVSLDTFNTEGEQSE